MAVNNLTKLIDYYHDNKLAHAYLIETNNPEKCFQDLLFVIKNINCQNSFDINCEKCNLCYLIENNILPSLIVIEPDGQNIKKEQIVNLKKLFASVPIYTENNIYIVKYTEKLNGSSANTMLKFLEEPDDNIIGFFITNNINNVLPTIESRCEILRIHYDESNFDINKLLEDASYNNYFEKAIDYLNKIEVEKKDSIMYNRDVLLQEFTEKEDIIIIFKIILQIYDRLLSNNLSKQLREKLYFVNNLTISDLISRIELVMSFLNDINCNVNKELLLDKFVIELSDING